jgi:hypothetical protein
MSSVRVVVSPDEASRSGPEFKTVTAEIDRLCPTCWSPDRGYGRSERAACASLGLTERETHALEMTVDPAHSSRLKAQADIDPPQ